MLRSAKDNMLYIGFCADLKTRINYHHKGYVKSTIARRPLKLIHYEFFTNKFDAIRRERYLKTTQGQKGLKLDLREYFKSSP